MTPTTPVPPPRRRRLGLAALALALTVVLAGCGGDGDDGEATAAATEGDPSNVTLRWAVQADGVRSLLKASGQLDDVPYKIEFAEFQFGPPIVEALGAGKVDIGWVGSTPPIFGAAAQTNFRVIGSIHRRNKTGAGILVKKDSGITDVSQLKGKNVAIPKGSNAHGLLLTALHRVGLKPTDVKPVYLPPADGLTAFDRGRVDALAIWEPYIAVATAKGATVLAGGPPDEDGYGFELASSAALDDPDKAAAVKDAVKRLQIAIAWGNDNPEEFAKAWSEESKLPLDVTRPAVPEILQDLIPVDDAAIASQQKLADRLFEDDVIPKRVDFASIVDRDILTTAEPAQ
ncbi:MAG: ABC transporter substrate-binding protein [Solirubrobacteraceae bacterium]|nr:ABC transporter substrate-binding protein [Solirubrobacteraceae bacterium]